MRGGICHSVAAAVLWMPFVPVRRGHVVVVQFKAAVQPKHRIQHKRPYERPRAVATLFQQRAQTRDIVRRLPRTLVCKPCSGGSRPVSIVAW